MMHELIGQYLDQVTAFLTVADQGSFAAAARQMGRDASVLSKRVSALEERLGIRLMERSTRSLALTEAGQTYANRMRAILQAMAEAEEETSTQTAEPRGILRLALPYAFGRQWIAPILPSFLAAYPKVDLDVTYSDHFTDMHVENMDLAIRIGSLPDSSLTARKLFDQKRLVCATPGYLERHGHLQDPEDLAQHNCFHFKGLASYPYWRFRRGSKTKSVRVRGCLQANDAGTLLEAVRAGQGVTLVSNWLVGPDLATGALVDILPDWQVEGEGAIYIVRPSNRFESGKVSAFTQWLLETINPPPWL